MTDFLVNNPNITILYFFVSIFIMGASAISIFFMYKTIKHNKKRDSDETFLLTITTGLFFLFSALSYVHFQELMDQYAVTNQKVEQYYIIEKVGNNLLFTEKESHPALFSFLINHGRNHFRVEAWSNICNNYMWDEKIEWIE